MKHFIWNDIKTTNVRMYMFVRSVPKQCFCFPACTEAYRETQKGSGETEGGGGILIKMKSF